ncbi:uncharacterized protein LOC125530187 isoform X3 [Triticum urartu]|uniref:uncharacterized protein LOC125530187 isoform X3 n=1 Tax=Triticum urartu TaxID=4572 RepID=UPI002044A3B9|nr:uncharacterized protein LOC125530187 isoform X3 [Triticum urartu]
MASVLMVERQRGLMGWIQTDEAVQDCSEQGEIGYYTVLVCLSCTEMKCSTRASTHKPRFILYGECQAILEAVRAIKMIMTLMMRRMTSMATREMIAVAISIMIK